MFRSFQIPSSLLVLPLLSTVLLGCPSELVSPDDPGIFSPPLDLPDNIIVGDEIVCDNPVEGFDRFERVEFSIPEGLAPDWPDPYNQVALTVAVHDLDGDGDQDLVLERPNGAFFGHVLSGYQIIEREGDGWVVHPIQKFIEDPDSMVFPENMTFADMDGDGLPEMIASGLDAVVQFQNLGDLEFGPPTYVRGGTFSGDLIGIFNASSIADLDGDGDLDVASVTSGGLTPAMLDGEEEIPYPHPTFGHALLFNEGETFSERLFVGDDIPWGTEVVHTTDADGDGDMEVIIAGDLSSGTPPLAFLEHNGGTWNNASEERGTDILAASMGLASWDFNQDGHLDYCITDIGGTQCLVSSPQGYIESGTALGFHSPSTSSAPNYWSGWSMEITDFDNDGLADSAIAGGLPWRDFNVENNNTAHPDAIYQGTSLTTFQDRTADLSFGETDHHYGLAVADLEGDGFWEIVVAGSYGPDLIWMNPCGAGNWIDIDLQGLPENSEAFGARVEVDDGRLFTQEMSAGRAYGQSPSELHFGLQDVETVQVRVTWPDGEETQAELPTRRKVRVVHPNR